MIDDHLLLRVLLGEEPAELRPNGGRLFTTGLWYHRLGRALADTTVTGVMSRSLGNASADLSAGAVAAVAELPDTIGLISLRDLAWPMANLVSSGARLNLMSLEALAAAEHLGAELRLATADTNPQLLAAATERGITTQLVATV